MFGGSDFRGSERFFSFGQSPNTGVIFQKSALKFNKNCKIIEKNKANANFSEFLNFLAGL